MAEGSPGSRLSPSRADGQADEDSPWPPRPRTHRPRQSALCHALLLQEIDGMTFALAEQREQDMGTGDLVLTCRLHPDSGALDHALETGGRLRVALARRHQPGQVFLEEADQAGPQFFQVSVAGPQCQLYVDIIEQGEDEVLQRGVFVPLLGGEGQSGLQGALEGPGQHSVSPLRVSDLLPYGVCRSLAVRGAHIGLRASLQTGRPGPPICPLTPHRDKPRRDRRARGIKNQPNIAVELYPSLRVGDDGRRQSSSEITAEVTAVGPRSTELFLQRRPTDRRRLLQSVQPVGEPDVQIQRSRPVGQLTQCRFTQRDRMLPECVVEYFVQYHPIDPERNLAFVLAAVVVEAQSGADEAAFNPAVGSVAFPREA